MAFHSERLAASWLSDLQVNVLTVGLDPCGRNGMRDSMRHGRVTVHMQNRLYIGNLAKAAMANELQELFASHGFTMGADAASPATVSSLGDARSSGGVSRSNAAHSRAPRGLS